MYAKRSDESYYSKTSYYNLMKRIYITTFMTSVASASLRVIGGRDASIEEYPYIVRIEIRHDREFSHLCTGSTISPEWTLSARHCTTDEDIESLVIRYGKVPTSEDDPVHGTISVFDIVTFPDIRNEEIHYDDIELLKTGPIQLPWYGRVSGVALRSLLYQEVIVAGFGSTNFTNLDGSGPPVDTLSLTKPLQINKGILMDNCEGRPYSLCVNAACGRFTAICPGDSGGPVIHASGIVAIHTQYLALNCHSAIDAYQNPEIVGVTPAIVYMDWISRVVSGTNIQMMS